MGTRNALNKNDNLFLAYNHYLETIAGQCAEEVIKRRRQ